MLDPVELNGRIRCQMLEPFGLMLIVPSQFALNELEPKFLTQQVDKHKMVIVRNLSELTANAFLTYAKKLGQLLEWDFGPIMEMKVHEKPKNYLFTNGKVPFHWDGAFFKVPHYLLFNCIDAPLPDAGGETLFTETNLIWQQATLEEKKRWEPLTLTYATDKLSHYGGQVSVKLVQDHPHTKETILRFAEPVPATFLNPVEVNVDGLTTDKANDIIAELSHYCYRFAYSHEWQPNDFLIVDNHAVVHARNAFTKFSPRHLRRIQVL